MCWRFSAIDFDAIGDTHTIHDFVVFVREQSHPENKKIGAAERVRRELNAIVSRSGNLFAMQNRETISRT